MASQEKVKRSVKKKSLYDKTWDKAMNKVGDFSGANKTRGEKLSYNPENQKKGLGKSLNSAAVKVIDAITPSYADAPRLGKSVSPKLKKTITERYLNDPKVPYTRRLLEKNMSEPKATRKALFSLPKKKAEKVAKQNNERKKKGVNSLKNTLKTGAQYIKQSKTAIKYLTKDRKKAERF